MKRQCYRAGIILCGVAALAAAVEPPPPVAGRMYDLFKRLQTPRQRVNFRLTDAEINEYMAYSLRATPRPGVQSVNVKMFPHNYVSTYTVVDFDAIEKWKPGTVPLLLRPVLNGRKAIWVDYRFNAWDGKATFAVEKAYFEKVRIPAYVVEKMIGIVAARQPEHYDTSKPVPLPFGLRKVWTGDHSVSGEN